MKAVGMFGQGIAAYDSGKYTRDAMKANARNVGNVGVMERDRIREASRLQMGQQLVDQGGSGFSMGTGTGLEALHQSAINRELDFALSRAKASNAAGQYRIQGRQAYAAGKSAMVGGIISGAAEIASEVAGAMGGMPGGGGGGMMNFGGSGGAVMNAPSFGSTSLSGMSDFGGPSPFAGVSY